MDDPVESMSPEKDGPTTQLLKQQEFDRKHHFNRLMNQAFDPIKNQFNKDIE